MTDNSNAQGLISVAKGGILNLVGLFLSLLFNFAYQFILIRTLTPADIGLLNLGLTITGIIGLILVFGMDRAVIRQIAYYSSTDQFELGLGVVPSAFSILTLTTLLVIPICWQIATPLSEIAFKKPELASVLQILLVGVPFAMFTRLAMGILQAYKLMKPLVLIDQIVSPLIRIIGTLIIITIFARTLGWISLSYVLMTVLGSGIAIYIFFPYYRSRKKSYKPRKNYIDLLKFSWPLLGASLLNRTNTFTETLMLGGLSSSEQVGLFSVSLKLAITLTIISQAINTAVAPFIAEMFAKSDQVHLSLQFKAVTRWSSILALPLGLITCLNAHDILTVLNPEYLSGVPVLQMLSLSQLVYVFVGPVALILTMTTYVRINLVDLLITLVLSLILDITLIPPFGAYGAAIASMISVLFINGLLRLFQVYKLFGIHPYNFGYIKPIFASFFAFLAFLGTSHLVRFYSPLARLFATSFIFIAVYGAFIALVHQDETDSEVFHLILQDVLSRRYK